MKATLTNGYDSKSIECETAIIHVSKSAVVHIGHDSVLVYIDGFQFAQYMLTDPKPNTKLLKFQAETTRYKPKETAKKIHVPTATVFFNALFENWVKSIKSWRDLLK